MPDAPDVTVRKPALLAAVHEHVLAAVTGIVPVAPAALTLAGTLPSETPHVLEAAVDSLFEQAAASATAADTANTSSRRGYVMAEYFSANPVRYDP